MSITNRFYESVCSASRKIFENALSDASNWNNNLMVPMETHVREHHTQLRRRLESVKRIHKASDTVETRLKELTVMHGKLSEQHSEFNGFKKQLMLLIEPPVEEEIKIEDKSQDNDADNDSQGADILIWNHGTNG